MRRTVTAAALGVAGLLWTIVPASAAGTSSHDRTPNWNQRDTAAYVVSTLNLLHLRNGRPVIQVLSRKLGVTRYDVYADSSVADLYFIQLKRDDGTEVGAFAYQIGWSKPQMLSLKIRHPMAHRATGRIFQEYRDDSKQLIASFTSTLPS